MVSTLTEGGGEGEALVKQWESASDLEGAEGAGLDVELVATWRIGV